MADGCDSRTLSSLVAELLGKVFLWVPGLRTTSAQAEGRPSAQVWRQNLRCSLPTVAECSYG